MKETCFVPDTNFFLDFPEFEQFFAALRTRIRLVIVFPVLVELDNIRARRFRRRSHGDSKDIGFLADQVMKRLTTIVSEAPTSIHAEVFRVREIAGSGHPDAQVVDHVIAFARGVQPDANVFFITRDTGLPTVLAHHEIRSNGLGNVLHLVAPERLEEQLDRCCEPAVTLDAIRLAPENDWHTAPAAKLVCDLTAYDMKGRYLCLNAIYLNANGDTRQAEDSKRIDAAVETVRDLILSMPFELIGTRPARHGMTRIPLTLTAGQRGREPYPMTNNQYALDLALGRVMLTRNAAA